MAKRKRTAEPGRSAHHSHTMSRDVPVPPRTTHPVNYPSRDFAGFGPRPFPSATPQRGQHIFFVNPNTSTPHGVASSRTPTWSQPRQGRGASRCSRGHNQPSSIAAKHEHLVDPAVPALPDKEAEAVTDRHLRVTPSPSPGGRGSSFTNNARPDQPFPALHSPHRHGHYPARIDGSSLNTKQLGADKDYEDYCRRSLPQLETLEREFRVGSDRAAPFALKDRSRFKEWETLMKAEFKRKNVLDFVLGRVERKMSKGEALLQLADSPPSATRRFKMLELAIDTRVCQVIFHHLGRSFREPCVNIEYAAELWKRVRAEYKPKGPVAIAETYNAYATCTVHSHKGNIASYCKEFRGIIEDLDELYGPDDTRGASTRMRMHVMAFLNGFKGTDLQTWANEQMTSETALTTTVGQLCEILDKKMKPRRQG